MSSVGMDAQLKPLKFGCIGASKIALAAVIKPAETHPEVILYAVAARDPERAKEYAKNHGFQKSYGGENSYQELIDDPEVDVIYNALPNALHFEWTMKSLAGGKHVLLEKPATDTASEAEEIFLLAKQKGLVVLEAFHYRFHPAIQRVKAILDSKELGNIKVISASLTAPAGAVPEGDIRWSYELGGGSTMDPGCYTVNVTRYLASSEPKAVEYAIAKLYSPAPGYERVDRSFNATLSFENGVIGKLHSDLSVAPIDGVPAKPSLGATITCERGTVEINNFLVPMYYHAITVTPTSGEKRVEEAFTFNGTAKGEKSWSTYRYQIEAFVDELNGRTPQTWIESQDTVNNMKWIEAIYEKDGLGSRPKSRYAHK